MRKLCIQIVFFLYDKAIFHVMGYGSKISGDQIFQKFVIESFFITWTMGIVGEREASEEEENVLPGCNEREVPVRR